MITSKQAYAKFGDPSVNEGKHMVIWDVPTHLEIGAIPKRIYCNSLMIKPLWKAFDAVLEKNLHGQIKTWDGCFNIRRKRGAASSSLHSWGLAIDINAAWNGFGKKPTMSPELVKCFTDNGFDWGGTWSKPDGMHLQLKEFPK